MKNDLKPGSSASDAKKIGGQGDFGVPESDVVERNYSSANTRHSDPGGAEPRGGTISRETGVGGNASGPGSASGGDLDTDFVGVGNGRGFSQNGPDKDYHGGPDEAQPGSSKPDHKSSPMPQDLNRPGAGQSTVTRAPDNPSSSQGADAATNPTARHDDSFAAEVSRDEASGRNSQ